MGSILFVKSSTEKKRILKNKLAIIDLKKKIKVKKYFRQKYSQYIIIDL